MGEMSRQEQQQEQEEAATMLQKHKERERQALEFIERVTSDAASVQLQVLSSILERNSKTEYVNRFGLGGRCDKESFKKCLPVITYEDLEPEIQRIANGDTSPILSAHPISEFLTSSGTSAGQRKLMPTISEEFERRCLLYSLLMPVMNQYLPGLDKGKGMYLFFIKSEAKTPGGLLARPVLTSYYKSRYFTERPYDPSNVYTSPNATVLCSDAHQSMYCQLLCGLLQRDQVLRMGAVFASGFLRAIRFLEQHWRELCDDIASGSLNQLVVDAAARESVMELMQRPNPELAAAIAAECQSSSGACSSWQGIITRLWPNTKYIDVIVTGTMAQYIPTLDYYSGGLPLVCTMYASSECYFGINLNPLCPPSQVSYTLLPNMAYFEFLPVSPDSSSSSSDSSSEDDGGSDEEDGREHDESRCRHRHRHHPHQYHIHSRRCQHPKTTASPVPGNDQQGQQEYEKKNNNNNNNVGLNNTKKKNKSKKNKDVELVDLVDVKLGHEYELVITTYAGLYRYRVGDILRVTGFHNAAPQFAFVCRKNVVLSIDSDKTGEEDLAKAVQIATAKIQKTHGARLIEYTSYADLSTIPGHYVLFWELRCNSGEEAATMIEREAIEACCLCIEENLDSVYRQGRCSDKSIGPLEIRLVKPGTFDALMDYALSRGASINQYKTPRCVKYTPIVELLNARVVNSYFSQRLPQWSAVRPQWSNNTTTTTTVTTTTTANATVPAVPVPAAGALVVNGNKNNNDTSAAPPVAAVS